MVRDERVLDERYDTIVIGSGVGGLAAASVLAQLAGHRVLVLERHFKLGGFTHSFQRPVRLGRSGGSGHYSWDVGVHYVGAMRPVAQERRLFDLVTAGRVSWNRLPDRFDRFHFPGLMVGVPSDAARYRAELKGLFPTETAAVDRWFAELERAATWMNRAAAATAMPGLIGRLMVAAGRASSTRTVAAALDEVGVSDRRLRAVLAAQWGTYGLPPSRAPFALHALVATHYEDGAWFPDGGGDVIPHAVKRIVEDAGGACLVDHEVTDILLDHDGRAHGVRVITRDGPVELFAPHVVSDAGAAITYRHLLPDLDLPQQRPATERVATAVTAYLGLSEDPRTLPGTDGGNHWLYTGYDIDGLLDDRARLLDGDPGWAFLSFGSVRAGIDGPHTAQVLTASDFAPFEQWAGESWHRRGPEYDALKGRMADGLVQLADHYLPGLADLVDYVEVSTPLTVASMTGQPDGAIYGTPITPRELRHGRPGAATPVPGLVLAGADVAFLGIVGAMMGGVLAASDILGPMGLPRIVRAATHAPQDVATQHQAPLETPALTR